MKKQLLILLLIVLAFHTNFCNRKVTSYKQQRAMLSTPQSAWKSIWMYVPQRKVFTVWRSPLHKLKIPHTGLPEGIQRLLPDLQIIELVIFNFKNDNKGCALLKKGPTEKSIKQTQTPPRSTDHLNVEPCYFQNFLNICIHISDTQGLRTCHIQFF